MQKILSCITTCGTVVNCLWYAATWSVKINNSNYAWGEGGNQESPILFYTSQQEHTQRPGGGGTAEMKDACVTQRRGELVQCWCLLFLPPSSHTAPSALVRSAAEKPNDPDHHLSLSTLDAIPPQHHRAFLKHDYLRGRDGAVYLLGCSDVLKVTVANAFNSVVLQPRWLTQDQLSGWTKMYSLVGVWCS